MFGMNKIYVKVVLKLNKQIAFYLYKRQIDSEYDMVAALDYDYYHQTVEQDFRIGELGTNLKKKTYCVATLNEAYEKMRESELVSSEIQANENFVCQKIKFFFKNHIDFSEVSKISDTFLINHANYLAIKKCSNQLIREFFNQVDFKQLGFIAVEECPISDQNLQDVLDQINAQKSHVDDNPNNKNSSSTKQTYSFINVEIQLKKCQYLSPSALDCLKDWDNNSFLEPENKKQGNGLSLIGVTFLRSTTLIQFAASQFYKQLRKIKIKKHPILQGEQGQILNQMLQFRNFTKKSQIGLYNEAKKNQILNRADNENENDSEYSESNQDQDQEEEIQSEVIQSDEKFLDIKSNLERLSFDYSVCHDFDSLPLNSDYYTNIKTISYNGFDISAKQRKDKKEAKDSLVANITFNNMFPYSLRELKILKLKYCNITSKCLINLRHMDCLSKIQVISFKGCFIDMKELKTLLISTRLQNLKSLNVSKTNIDDSFCTTVSDNSVVSFSLQEIDVSKTQITLKGLKYLTQIDTLRCINMKNMDCINCQISTFIIDILENKRNLFIRQQLSQLGLINDNEYQDKESQLVQRDQLQLNNSGDVHKDYQKLKLISKKSPSIVHLDFSDCSFVNSALIEELFKHRLLNRCAYIDLSNTKVCNKFIDILLESSQSKENSLQEYWVSHKRKAYDKSNSVSILEAQEAESIHLNLRHLSIRSCKQIRGFKIRGFFKYVQLPSLEILDMSQTNLFDDSLNRFITYFYDNFSQLCKLKINTIKASSKELSNLRMLPEKNLVYIDLKRTNFDDEACARFFSDQNNKLLRTLQYMSIKDCNQLTTRGIESMIDGLANESYAQIFTKRFQVSEEQKQEMLENEKKRMKDELEQQKKRKEEIKKKEKEMMKKSKKSSKDNSSKSKFNFNFGGILDIFKSDQNKQRKVCENFDVFQILQDCSHLVTDDVFNQFIVNLQHMVQNIFEMNLNSMGRLVLNEFSFENPQIQKDIFKNLEIININDTRITNVFVQNLLKFWISVNSEKKSEDFKMKNFIFIKCAKAHFVDSSILDVFRKNSDLRHIINKTKFKIELLLNEVGQKIQDESLLFMKDLKKNLESKNVSTNIRELNLENNQFLSQTGFQTLLSSNWMKFIMRLNVRNTQFGDAQLEYIYNSQLKSSHHSLFSKLQYIGMKGCLYVSKQGLHLLCKMEKLNEGFDLGCICELKMLIDEDLMKAMAQSVYMCNADYLDLSDNGFKNIDIGFKYLCFKGREKRLKLRTINVSSTWISDKALQSLAVTENFCNLERIILTNCKKISERGISYLVDSRMLYNLDLFYLFNSNPSLVSGRVIDTLKYSDRKKTIKEISLQGSLSQDKEVNNIMQEIVSKSLLIKTIDLRKTSYISIQGLSYVYSMMQWNVIKNMSKDDDGCHLEVLIIDNNRYQEFNVRYSYQDIMNQLTKDQKEAIQFEEKQIEEYKLPSEEPKKYMDKIPYASAMQMTPVVFAQHCKELKDQYQHKILTSNKPTKLNEIFIGSFVQDLFLSANSLKKFRYDYFIKRFALNIDNKFFDSLSLCDQKWSLQEEVDGRNEKKASNQKDSLMKNLNKGFKNQEENQEDQNQASQEFPNFKDIFEYLYLAYNKILNDDSMCRFFLSTQIIKNLKEIDISYTLLTEKVVLAICASVYLRESLQIIFFEKCPNLKIKKSLEYILLTDFYSFKYQSLLSQYYYEVDDEIVSLILYKFTDQELRQLNFQYSKITSKGLRLIGNSSRQDTIEQLDLANTGIEAEEFDNFMSIDKTPFPKGLKYMWIENTYNLTDQKFSELRFWKTFCSDNFDLMEMLQSKQRRLSATLKHLANKEIRDYIFKKSYIQLEIFPQIQSETLIQLINECFAKESDTFKELKYIYLNFRKQNYQALKNCFEWNPKEVNIQKVCEKFSFKIISIPSEYQGVPAIKLLTQNLQSKIQQVKDSIQFETYEYLTALDYKYILQLNKLINNQTLLKLVLDNTDISGNLFSKLCDSIVGKYNYITYVSVKNIQQIRDEHIINMLFDVSTDEIISSFQQIKLNNQTTKLSEMMQNKELKKKQTEMKLKQFAEIKKFPYLVDLNIEGTKVTQNSLCQILSTIPFNMSFRIQNLFKQYCESTYSKLDDHVIYELSQSPYLQNFTTLDITKIECTSSSLIKIFKSQKAINIKEIYLNTTNISEDAFVSLANSKNLPKLQKISIKDDDKILVKSYHYFLRAQYLSMNLKIENLMKKPEVVDTSQFIQAMINSFYMNNIKFIEINNCNLFMNQIKSLFKLSRFTGFIDRVTLNDVKDAEEYKDVWITIAQSKSFPRLQQLSIKSLEIKEHLIILLKQKYKPKFDIESLLKDNKKLIDDQIIVEIAQLPHLLNSKEIDLSDLYKIKPRAWEAFANSKYVGNLKTINFSFCTLMSSKTENDQQILNYFKQEQDFNEKTKCQSLFQKNNFFNLDKIIINNNKGLHISEIEYILQAVKKRHVSVRFDFEDIFIQLIEQVKPFLIEYAEQEMDDEEEDDDFDDLDEEQQEILKQLQDNSNKDQFKNKQELTYYIWEEYIPKLNSLFEKYFLKTREWYNKRHTTLDLTYFQFLIRFVDFQNVFRQIQDLSCIQHMKFYNFGFDSVFSQKDMKFLNLKTVKILDLFNEKSHLTDKTGQQLSRVINQQYIKPYYFNINSFIENYTINQRIQNIFLNSKYMEIQEHFIIYLQFIDKDQIERIFAKKMQFSAYKIDIRESQSDDKNEIDRASNIEKQELFLTKLAESKCFSGIKQLVTVLPISLKCAKLLIKSDIFSRSFDIQSLVAQTEVDEEYFDILQNSSYFQYLNYLLIPKLAEVSIDNQQSNSKQQQSQQSNNQSSQSGDTLQKGKKFKLNFQKLNINRIQRLTMIKIIEHVEDHDFLLNLFKQDNVRFNSNLAQNDRIDFKKLESVHFQKLFTQPFYGFDWTQVFNLLQKNLASIDGSVYEAILLNKSACFFLNKLEIPDSVSKEIAGEIIEQITKTMDKIKDFMPLLQLQKLIIKSFPENSTKIRDFFLFIQNLKEIQFKQDIQFGLEEAKTLLSHTKNTNLAETVINWILPNLNLQQIQELTEVIKVDKEIPENVSYLDFSGNQHLISKDSLTKQINDLRTNKKKTKEDEFDEMNQEENQEENNKDGAEDDDKDKDKNKNEQDNKLEDGGAMAGAGGDQEENQGQNEDGQGNDDDKGEKNNEENDKKDVDKKQLIHQIQALQKNSINEDNLYEFLSLFKGLREISLRKTTADSYHLVKIKKLKQSNLLHFINFEDCFEIKNSVTFNILLSDDLKPWFQLNKYLDNLPLSRAKQQKQFLKNLFECDFFKHNFKYLNFDFILKINQSNNHELLQMFEFIIKKIIFNLDITALMQNLPNYMKLAVNDNHIEKICKEYGSVHYLQPEKFPLVQYGFNHILQQKNIPTSIRLMYLLNETFQKRISASSLSLIYQLALESDKLKQKNILKENDEQLKQLLLVTKKKAQKKQLQIQRRKEKMEKQLQRLKDRKYTKILNAVGKKVPQSKIDQKKKKQQEQLAPQKQLTLKESKYKSGDSKMDSPLLTPQQEEFLPQNDPFDDGEVEKKLNDDSEFMLNERELFNQEQRKQNLELLEQSASHEKEEQQDQEYLDQVEKELNEENEEDEDQQNEGNEEGEGEGEEEEDNQNQSDEKIDQEDQEINNFEQENDEEQHLNSQQNEDVKSDGEDFQQKQKQDEIKDEENKFLSNGDNQSQREQEQKRDNDQASDRISDEKNQDIDQNILSQQNEKADENEKAEENEKIDENDKVDEQQEGQETTTSKMQTYQTIQKLKFGSTNEKDNLKGALSLEDDLKQQNNIYKKIVLPQDSSYINSANAAIQQSENKTINAHQNTINEENNLMSSQENESQSHTPLSHKKRKNMEHRMSVAQTASKFSKKTKTKKEKTLKLIKHQFDEIKMSQLTLQSNTSRIYNNPIALKLHKELVKLHLMSEDLKNEDKKINEFTQKYKDLDNQIDVLEFEIQLLDTNKRDNNYEIENLFSFIEALNLGENNHLNIYGLNYYISQHIQPWIKLNQNILELKEGKDRSSKVKNQFQEKEEDDMISGVINPDHVLDDKLFEHLSYLIEERLKQLREINLRGLNVSDDFAEKFSLILGDDGKLTHLNLLDLSQNRRLSPFGLKFLFSSIVNRIPEGFKIIISATGNDADHLRLQVELLERSIMTEAVWVVKKYKKEIAHYIKKNKKKLNALTDNKIVPFNKRPSIEDLDSAENHVANPQQLNLQMFDPNIPKFFDEEEEQKNQEDDLSKEKIELDEVQKELQKLDYQSEISQDERDQKEYESQDLKFLFIEEQQSLDKKIVKKLEQDKTFKDKVLRLRNLQKAYKKALEECGGGLSQVVDARMIVQNIVNLGLFDAINLIVKDTWKKNKITILFISLILFPLTAFHLIMLLSFKIQYYIKKIMASFRKSSKKKIENQQIIEFDKMVPENIENTDFYFDEDVAQLDIFLARNKNKKSSTDFLRRQGRLLAEYIKSPLKKNFDKIYEEITNNRVKERHIVKYVDLLFWINIFVIIIGLTVLYPFFLVRYYLPEYESKYSCGKYPVQYDTPFLFFTSMMVVLEAFVLYDIQNIIVSKKIFTMKSISVILLLYNSFMLRYSVYSNMVFSHNIYFCKTAEDLGLVALIFLHVQIVWTVIPALINMISIYRLKKQSLSKSIHNTAFINLFTQIGQQLDFMALSSLLDRFSTSSTIQLTGFFIPNFLNNVKIPQILLTKFQKLIYLDLPTISILLVYNIRKSSAESITSFTNLRVIITTFLSLYGSLSQAWLAHPSLFRTYQMQDYLKFRQNTSQIYKIKIGTVDNMQYFKLQDVLSKTFRFNQKYTLKIETKEEKQAKLKKEKERKERQKRQKADGSSKVASSQAGSQVSESRSQAAGSQRSIGSQNSIQSRQSQVNVKEENVFVDKRKIITPENFQQLLIEFIKKSDKLILDEEADQQEQKVV
ncbi:transmembrane protein, putative (macronuclear) [Tetrahymena thermophila SB210]|uniref:Transmembrane protein, putative n=1 Tax=Tetrahymena thermophila (strain SB210) TaxID=312017 RepID=W7X710_TETTS|nr:transmembrane protein, putative [Tetrahymena thermophila SB210]EWS75170.1 transmembrane protein, putative [Tetrahymena thermophila SB210]|eukprot:XP_012652326.1 transmembrane protein, putative [Tetrahymena thermophila SB210]